MKLDRCPYCEAFVSTRKKIDWCLFFFIGFFAALFPKRICIHCGSKTYKIRYKK